MPAGGKIGNRGNRVGPHLSGIPPADSEKRCKAINNSNGQRCATWAVGGSAFCKMHQGRREKMIPSPTDALTAERRKRGHRYSDVCVDPIMKANLAAIEEELDDPNKRFSLKSSEAIVKFQADQAVNVYIATFSGKLDKPGNDQWNSEIRETAALKLKEAQKWLKEFNDGSARIEVMRREIYKDEGLSKVVVMQIMGIIEKHLGQNNSDPKMRELYNDLIADLSQIQSLGSVAPKVTITI